MKSLRIYLRKSDMVGDYFDGEGERGGCPIYRCLYRIYGKTHKIKVGGSFVSFEDKLTGGTKRFQIVNWLNFAGLPGIPVNERKGTKIRIKGLTLPS